MYTYAFGVILIFGENCYRDGHFGGINNVTGGIQLFCLGMIAEYIWRIYDEVKARPGYIIKRSEQIKSDRTE